MIELVLSCVAGFLAHLLERPTARWVEDRDINFLVRSAEGVLVIIAVYALVVWRKLPPPHRWTAVSSLAATALGVGVGVAGGYIVDGMRGGYE